MHNTLQQDALKAERCSCEQMRAEGYREVCPYCIATKDWSRGPTPIEAVETAEARNASPDYELGFAAGIEAAAEHVLGALACSICLQINGCKCDYDKAVSAGPCQPPADILAASIRTLNPTTDALKAENERRLREALRPFKMQDGPPIPWALAEVIYSGYSRLFGSTQSIERLAERGGFGWAEVEHIFNKLNRYPAARDEFRKYPEALQTRAALTEQPQ